MRLRAPSTPRKGPSSRVASVRPYALAGGTLAVGFGGLYLAGLLAAGGDIEDGTTVRGVDIGGLSRLPATARPAFTHIARVVESSLFGGRSVDQTTYADCRQAYESFAFPQAWAT